MPFFFGYEDKKKTRKLVDEKFIPESTKSKFFKGVDKKPDKTTQFYDINYKNRKLYQWDSSSGEYVHKKTGQPRRNWVYRKNGGWGF